MIDGLKLLQGALFTLLTCIGAPALAQQPLTEERCPRMVAELPPLIVPASLRMAAVDPGEVRITYVGHSTFEIESAAGVRIATDYNDHVRPKTVPHIATMNRAHSTHYTNNPRSFDRPRPPRLGPGRRAGSARRRL
jgi:hypothetical protein